MKPLILMTLAHAGGSASALAHFRRHLPHAIEARPVELPGHGRRFREPLLAARAALIAQLASELVPTLHGQSYALFGHSLGGMLAFDLAHALIGRGASVPRAVCVAAAPAPCSQQLRRPQETWQTDEALVQSLRSLGGTPPELFEHPELLELFLPVVRADFKLCTDVPVPALGPLPCPVHVYAGRKDDVSEEALQGWRRASVAAQTLSYFDGDHFFVRTHARELCTQLADHLLTPHQAHSAATFAARAQH